MGIPPIHPYRMPGEAELPPSVPSWRPDPRRALLLVHDMQRYFIDFYPAGQPPVTELLANIGRIRAAAAKHGMPVVYTAQPAMDRRQRGLLLDIWGPGMGADPDRRAIVAEAAPAPTDIVVPKPRYGAFHRSGLRNIIASLGRDQLIVCGVYAHVGCLVTVCEAFARDIEAFLVADAVADFSVEHHRLALDYAARLCAVTMTTSRLLRSLRTPD